MSHKQGTDVHAHWTVVETGTYKTEISPQGHDNIPGVNDHTAGTTQLAANLVVMGPGVKAKGHIHHDHETIIFLLDGFAVTFMGPDQEPVVQRPGDFLFIPKGVEHLPANLSRTQPAVGLVCRSDPKFYESLELLPHIDDIVAQLLPELQAKHETGELPADWRRHYKGAFNPANIKRVMPSNKAVALA